MTSARIRAEMRDAVGPDENISLQSLLAAQT